LEICVFWVKTYFSSKDLPLSWNIFCEKNNIVHTYLCTYCSYSTSSFLLLIYMSY
jgi:hypothetical protein